MKDGRNKRAFPRMECSIGIDVDDMIDNRYRATLKNISAGGAWIETPQKIHSVDKELMLTIPYQTNNELVIFKSRVTWSNHNGCGVRFVTKEWKFR